MEPQATQFFDLYRTGVRTASDVMKASLESVERVQSQQMQLLRSAMEENVKLMEYCSGVWRSVGSQAASALRDASPAANQEKRPEPQRRSA